MKGVIFKEAGAAPEVVDNLTKPEPADDQVLVKSLWTAINPVDAFMANYGLLVLEWPLVLGVDAAGIVVSAGETAKSKYNLKPGTYVCGCTRLGNIAYSTCQEYYLMDAAVTVPKPSNVSVIQSATLGVGTYTACLGLFANLQIPLLDPSNLPAQKDEYILILGGSGSVGKFAIQLARAAGYRVLASGSAKSKSTITDLGAEMFDYKASVESQASAVMSATGGKFNKIFDAAGEDDPKLAKLLFAQLDGAKHFTTTNDWSGIGDFEGGTTTLIRLGMVGRPDATELNGWIEKFVPVIHALAESGKIVPSAVEVVGGEEGGFESAIEAYKFQTAGKGGSKKVLVKIGSE